MFNKADGKLTRTLDGFGLPAQRGELHGALGNAIEERVDLLDFYAHRFEKLFAGKRRRFALRFRAGSIENRELGGNHIEHAQYLGDPVVRDGAAPLPACLEGFFNCVGQFRDGRLLGHARCALEGVGEPQQASDGILSAFASFEFEHHSAEPLQKFAGLDTEVLVWVCQHASRIRGGLD